MPHITRRAVLAAGASAALTALARGADRETWQIGCYTRPWDQYEYRVALDAIAEAGFKYAGIMTAKGKSGVMMTTQTTPEEAAQIGDEVQKRGLKAVSVYGDFSVSKSLNDGIAGLKHQIDNCAACACPNLLLGGTGDARRYDDYYKAIAECCDYAASKKIGLTIKPHGGQNATGPQCRKAIERVHHSSFRLWYDPGNIFYCSDGKLDPVDDAAMVDGLVAGMSVKDYLLPKEVLVTPGTGRVDFRQVFSRLRKGGFTAGPLVVECLAKGDAKAVTAEAIKARRFLENLTGQKA